MPREIPLTQGQVAIVDDEDFEMVRGFNWHYHGGYAVRTAADGRTKIQMHRVIINAPAGVQVDHINGDKLDNQRANLRLASHSENDRNKPAQAGGTSRFKGVSWNAARQKWQAQISVNNRLIYLGRYADETDAAKAYDKAAREHGGEFAYLNFPEEK